MLVPQVPKVSLVMPVWSVHQDHPVQLVNKVSLENQVNQVSKEVQV